MEIRPETPPDIAAVRQVNMAAFQRENEANLVDRLRGGTATFALVAVQTQQIVGHICFSPVSILGEQGENLLLLGLAPIAVLPEYQRQGIGTLLIQHGLKACVEFGCQAVVVLGDPQYYMRFGFIPAIQKGLKCQYDVPEEAFMILELVGGALTGGSGTIQYRPEFMNV